MSPPLSDARLKTVVLQAIRNAEKAAPDDDRAFLDALRMQAAAQVRVPGGGGARSVGSGARSRPRAPASTRIRATSLAYGPSRAARPPTPASSAARPSKGRSSPTVSPWATTTAGAARDAHRSKRRADGGALRGAAYAGVRGQRRRRKGPRVQGDPPRPASTMGQPPAPRRDAADPREEDHGCETAGDGARGARRRRLRRPRRRLRHHGARRENGYGVKRQTDVPIVSQACKGQVNGRSDDRVYGCHAGKEIVAGKPLLLHDTCKGDSGGPFFLADGRGRWFLAGVTSRGTGLATTMCGDGGLYVRVDQVQGLDRFGHQERVNRNAPLRGRSLGARYE